MDPLVVIFFVVIGLMRVVQKVCSKKVSDKIDGSTYFHYGGYYQLLSAIFSLVALCFVGFHGFSGTMVLYAVGTAVFMAIELFTEIEALKGTSLLVVQMFAAGAVVVPCLFGNFFIEGQEMSVYQWIGLALFMVAMYFMVSEGKTKQSEEISQDAVDVGQDTPTKQDAPKQKMSLKTIVMLVLMLIGAGGTTVVQDAFGNLVEDGNTAMYSFLIFAINAVVLYLCYLAQALLVKKGAKTMQVEPLAETQVAPKKEKKLKPLPMALLICGAFLALALFAINILVTELTSMVHPSLLFPLSNAIAIIVAMLVGRIMYKETMSVRNVIGIVLCAVSMAIITFL